MALTKKEIEGLTYDQLLEHIRLSKVNSDEYEGVAKHLNAELAEREPTVNYECAKCGHTRFEERQLRASGGGFSAIFEIQTDRYRVVSCERCKYSEIYHGEVGPWQTALDILIGS